MATPPLASSKLLRTGIVTAQNEPLSQFSFSPFEVLTSSPSLHSASYHPSPRD
ncbi:uncharacterized protein BO80DRAFT_424293 [Aspergillus ibericus CBS 121593]|uniref:Uncharacterized protein n=1 Tax=Aspergillus ibericus CBS 121593 TaxID=1448316 RepID=A0A395H214_9EURO|nr:hypothetical protein BO80DRAFT_424293 [Aspergillus ibericus CBS 121593]RAL01917.1 hypothetical protein BO80DRAFT_424293 [Aspergillus ibericus CBS 121593]